MNEASEIIAEIHAPSVSALGVYFFVLLTIITIASVFLVFGLGSVNNTSIALGTISPSKKLKCGIATSHCIFSSISSGDHSIQRACEDGDISFISSAMTTTKGVWFFSVTTTIIYGR